MWGVLFPTWNSKISSMYMQASPTWITLDYIPLPKDSIAAAHFQCSETSEIKDHLPITVTQIYKSHIWP